MNILLDLDGTLTDPRQGIVGCLRHAFAGLDEPCPPDGELERYIGPPLHVSFSDRFGAGSPKIARAIELYRERFSAIGMFENPTTFAERVVEHFALGDYIETIFGSELDGTRSDKAELIAHIVKARAIDPCMTYMVGDREHDMRGARRTALRESARCGATARARTCSRQAPQPCVNSRATCARSCESVRRPGTTALLVLLAVLAAFVWHNSQARSAPTADAFLRKSCRRPGRFPCRNGRLASCSLCSVPQKGVTAWVLS